MTSSDDEREGLIAPSDGETLPSSWGDPCRCRDASLSLDGATSCRLLERSAPSSRSRGLFRVRHEHLSWLETLARSDVFHKLANMPLRYLLPMYAVIYIVFWILFAVWWWLAAGGDTCDAELMTFRRAYLLSLETMMTIGYGVPDPGLRGCHAGIFVLGAAALWESLLNAVIISVVYTRVSRAQGRATSVCFSEKAIICQIEGQSYFMFQVCDFRKHQLCEAHVRLYCVQHSETPEGVTFQTRAMRLQHPDDELGGMLLLALPQIVVHRIDAWSPLCPPSSRVCAGGTSASCFRSFTEVPQRASDAENGQRELGKGVPRPPVPSLMQIARHLSQAQMEVLCLVEGVEPATSGTLQARCSYTNDDIVFNASFQRCVSRAADGTCEVNLDAFHELVQRPCDEFLVQSMP
mmetsp:Transcript_61972/g.191919  ORF Transcript_61972/g.191919 Transcript_61972/m.191919 type:complete len:407 (-) Transcript_61972:5-1225(-)